MQLGPKAFKFVLNLYPPFLFSRTRVRYISADWREVEVRLHKSLLTRNYVGTTFGGSMYGATDPFYMLMLIRILGIKNHIIWDKGAEIDFRRPARSDLTFHFVIRDEDLENIQHELEASGKAVPEFEVSGVDATGEICVVIKKLIYIKVKKQTLRR